MTHTLLDLGVRVTAFEIDRGFSRVLLELFGDNPSFRLVQGDFLDTWEGEYRQAGGPDRIIGNLPYSSGSAMIAALVQGDCRTDRLVFTLQKEVARRMTALPGGETYSSFSVLCQSVWDISYAGDIKGGSFYPVPDVVSGVVICVPHNRFRFTDRGIFDLLVRDLFASRRKTIRNNILSGNLAKRLPAELIFGAFTAEGVNLSDRGERIPVTVLAAVAERLSVERESGEPPPDGC